MFLHWIRWFNIVQANQHAKSSIQAFQHKSYLLSSTSTESTLDPLPLVIISMLFYMYRLDKEVIICDGNLHVNLFYYNKTPYITCTFFFLQNSSTMSILDPFFYCTSFLQFSLVTPRGIHQHHLFVCSCG